MMNFDQELNPEEFASHTGDADTVNDAIAAYEAMSDVEEAMLKVDMLEKAGTILADSMDTQAAMVAKGYESEAGVPGASDVGYAAVCTMLNINGGVTAGYEADDDKKQGLLSKIWEAIVKAAKKVWDFIVKMYEKVVNFIKGLFGKGETTDKVIEGLVASITPPSNTKLEPEDGGAVASDLSVLVMFGTGINPKSVQDLLKLQETLISGIGGLGVTDKISKAKSALGKISKIKKSKDKAVHKKITTGIIDAVNAIKLYDGKSDMASGELIKLVKGYGPAAKTITEVEHELTKNFDPSEYDVICVTGAITLTTKKVTVMSILGWTSKTDGDISGYTSKTYDLKPTEADLKVFMEKESITTLDDSTAKSLYEQSAKTVKVGNKIDSFIKAKDIAKEADALLEECKKAVTNSENFTDFENAKLVKESLKGLEILVTKAVPGVLKGISETAADAAKSRVSNYVKLSYKKFDD